MGRSVSPCRPAASESGSIQNMRSPRTDFTAICAPASRGLHPSISQFNVSGFCGMLDTFNRYMGHNSSLTGHKPAH